MNTPSHVIASAKKDLKRANDKLTELLGFDSNKECSTKLGHNREIVEKAIVSINKVNDDLSPLVKK